jgi:uncharacterized protein (DUF1499 family)
MAQTASGAARWPLRLGVAAVIAFVAGPLLAHFRVVPAMAGFLLFDLGGLLGIIAVLFGLVAALRGRAPWSALLPGAVVAVLFITTAAGAGKYPRINDITTDTQNPPQFVQAGSIPANQGRDMKYPGESFAQQQQAGYPDLKGLPLDVPPGDAYQRVLAAAKAMPGWQITRDDRVHLALEGIATSRLFRFQDDFVVEVRPRDGGSIVEMRSKSRDGKGDIGANAKRIESFFARLKG